MSQTRTVPFLDRLRSNWVMVVIFCGIGVLLIASGFLVKHFSDAGQRDLTATTTATVLAGAEESSRQQCESNHHSCHTDYDCKFKYTYTPAGAMKPYKDSWEDDSECGDAEKAGATRTAYYDPDRPGHVTLADPSSAGQKYAWLWLAAPGVLCFVFAGWTLKR